MDKEKRGSNEDEHAKKVESHWCSEYREMQQSLAIYPSGGDAGWEGAAYVSRVVFEQGRESYVREMRDHRESCEPCITHFSGGKIIFVDFKQDSNNLVEAVE